MHWKELLREYFHFTRKDRIAILVIASLLAFVIIYPWLAERHRAARSPVLADTAWIAAVKRLELPLPATGLVQDNNQQRGHFVEPGPDSLFVFNPNNASQEEWRALGLKEKTIRTILNYLQKGGRFGQPEDLQRIYGMISNEYRRLAPFIRIDEKGSFKDEGSKPPSHSPSPFTRVPIIRSVEINTADTSALIALPGIGSKLANRIINFRDKLGGFYSIEQVGETFGLADSVFRRIRPYLQLNSAFVKKIHVNTCAIDDLKNHPYIKYNMGNAIVAYRSQHGLFSRIDDLKNILLVTEVVFEKIVPYLEL